MKEAYGAETATWNNRKKYGNGKEAKAARRELAAGKQAVFRKYNLIP